MYPLANAPVSICRDGCCVTTSTGADGHYSVSGLPADTYRVTVLPPAADADLFPNGLANLAVAGTAVLAGQDVVLRPPQPPAPDVTVDTQGTVGDLPSLNPNVPLALTRTGLPGCAGTYRIREGGRTVAEGTMTETPPGSGTDAADVAPWPRTTLGVSIQTYVTCPLAGAVESSFDAYIDPSGHVRSKSGAGLSGISVTLLRSESPLGPFTVVPDGSALMSPMNRRNPDVTDASGHFGWDVIAGYYVVRAERPGCVVETPVQTIPPPVTDLDLRLACPDPFTCYKAKKASGSTAFAPRTVTLADLLGSASVTVKKPKLLCAPTAVDATDPSAPAHPDHLADYQITPPSGFEPIAALAATDRFGTWRLKVTKPATLQVPSAISRTAPPSAPASPEVDHFQCYKVARARDGEAFAAVSSLPIEDSLGAMTVDVLKPKRLCLAASKNGEAPAAANHRQHLLCYAIKQRSLPKFGKVTPIHEANQFGHETLDAIKPAELCVPAEVTR